MQARIALRQFSVTYPTFTLAPLSVEFKPGERVAFVGPNGAGKTTTLRALAGRLTEYEGAILFDGRDLRGLLPLGRREIGSMPESLGGYGWMTVRDHLAFLRQFYPTWDAGYAAHLVDRLHIPLDDAIGRLSKGTRAKVSFVAAEAYRPSLLLLDEPTSGLDPEVRGELIGMIVSSAVERPHRVVVFSTHLLEDVDQVAQRVLMLVDGKLTLDESVDRLRRSDSKMSLPKVLYAALGRAKSE